MKKTILALSLVATTLLMANDSLRTEIDITAGYNAFDSASKMDSASLFGLRATVYETEVNKYGLQVGYEGALGVDYEGTGKESDLHRLFTHMVVDGETEYHVTPYLFLGGGYEYLSDEIKGEPSQGFIDLGIGFKYFFENNFKVLLEGKGIGKFDTRDLDYHANLGLGYMFGGASKNSVKPIVTLDDKETITDIPTRITPPKTRNITIVRVPVKDRVSPVEIAPRTRINVVNSYTPVNVVSYEDTAVATKGAYYVQMAALAKTSTQPLIETLNTNGYHNTLVHPRGETSLVLVGPYNSSQEALAAQGALKSVREDAFIYKMQ